MSAKERISQSSLVCKRLTDWVTQNRQFRTVAVYRASGPEVDLSAFCSWAFTKNLDLALPVVLEGNTLAFRRYEPETPLAPNRYGIDEPVDSPEVPPEAFDLILVPGLGFTSDLDRLGRGAGFYDRYLARCPGALKAGVAFSCQLVESLPVESHDIRLDALFLPDRSFA